MRPFRFPALLHASIVLLVVTMLQPLLGTSAAAQATPLPENVLQASVRITANLQVVPDDRDEAPFLCTLPDDTLLEAWNGSGTIISEDGYILTNHHVMAEEDLPQEVLDYCEDQAPGGRGEVDYAFTAWLPDDKGTPADPYRTELIQDSSFEEDLALIKITEHLDGERVNTRRDPFPFVQFGDSDALREPEKIIMVGYPANAGTSRRVSEGIFSGWGDNGFGVPWIYTDATISGGNSGGTAVNAAGLFVGIPTRGTFSDCRKIDTNFDGQIDENDADCVGLGGNYGILIPSNIARDFAQEAIGAEIAVVEPPAVDETPVTEETPVDEETPSPDGPAIGEFTFHGFDLDGEEVDAFEEINQLDGCFENFTLEDGDPITVNWYIDGVEVLSTEYAWDEAWNPEACASIYVEKDDPDPILDAGTYTMEVVVGGETFASDEVSVTRATHVASVDFRARDSEREEFAAEDGVLTGEVSTLYVDIAFTDMTEGEIWQVDLYQDGEIVVSSDPEAWEGAAEGDATVRLRSAERGPIAAGEYEVVITIDGSESARVPLTIED